MRVSSHATQHMKEN